MPPVPSEVLARVLDPLWSAAVAAARDEQAEADAAERAALVRAEAEALTELAATGAARDEQTALAAGATKDATDARAAAHAAELIAAEAQATARTLREILDTVSKGSKGNRAKP